MKTNMATSMRGILFSRANLLSYIRIRSYGSKKSKNNQNKSVKSGRPTGGQSTVTENKNPKKNVTKYVLSDIMSDHVEQEEEVDYHDYIAERLNTARKTVLIKTNLIDSSVKKLEQFGMIENIRNSIKGHDLIHLVTFQDETSIQKLVSSFGKSDMFMKRIISDLKAEKTDTLKKELSPSLKEQLETCHNIDEQLNCLYEFTRQDDTDSLLIFLYYSIVQDVFKMLSNGILEPFGSCVSGFGMHSSDLDLNYIELKNDDSDNSLRPVIPYNRISTRNEIEALTRSLKSILPIISNGTAIPARIPIIRLAFKPVNCEMDIAFSGNRQGPLMSEIFYTYRMLDNRIAIIFAFVKRWALTNNVSKKTPGHWFSSFQLLALVIFFFQQRTNPTIPSIKALLDCNNFYVKSENHTRKSLPLYLIRNLTKNPSFESSLETLLKEFFEFYSTFDFSTIGISLLMGQTFKKTDNRKPIQCEFPFEFHNIMKNIDLHHRKALQTNSQKALVLINRTSSTNKVWGIASCLKKGEQVNLDMRISVKQLFED